MPTKRRIIQLYCALLYNAHLRGFVKGEIFTGKAKTVCVPGFNCYSCPGAIGACPLGAIQNAVGSLNKHIGFYVVDQNANPVVDAKVQFCTADTCKIGTTDETGVAIFDDPEGVYQVHVLKAPEEYEVDDTILATPDKYSDITIVLQAK